MNQSMLQQNLTNSPGYLVNAGVVEPKKSTQYNAAMKLMLQGKKPDSKIDHWKKHLLGVS